MANKKRMKPEDMIQQVLDMATEEQVNEAIGEENLEYEAISRAVVAWHVMFKAAFPRIARRTAGENNALNASLVVMGNLVRTVYALGVRMGERSAQLSAPKPKRTRSKRASESSDD